MKNKKFLPIILSAALLTGCAGKNEASVAAPPSPSAVSETSTVSSTSSSSETAEASTASSTEASSPISSAPLSSAEEVPSEPTVSSTPESLGVSEVPDSSEAPESSAEPDTSEAPASDFVYSENPLGEMYITAYNGTDTEIVIPAEIDGKPVTGVGAKAMKLAKNVELKTVKISEGIKTIEWE